MAEREIGLRFRVTATGLEVLDSAGNKLNEITRQAERAERETNAAFSKMERSAQRIGTAVGLAVSTVAVGFTLAIRQALDYADKLDDLAQSSGTSARFLSSLSVAAAQAGSSLEEVGVGLSLLNRKIVEAANGGDAGRLFTAMKITGKDAATVLDQIADQFQKLPDGPTKTAAAIELFGRSGARLIPILNQGSRGLGDLREEAQRLGIVIDNDTARAAGQLNDKIDLVKASGQGLAVAIAAGMIPALTQVADETLKWFEANDKVLKQDFTQWGSDFAKMLTGTVIPAIVSALGFVDKLAQGIGTLIVKFENIGQGTGLELLTRDAQRRVRSGETRGMRQQSRLDAATGSVWPESYIFGEYTDAPAFPPNTGPQIPGDTLLERRIQAALKSGGGDDAAKQRAREAADLEKRTAQDLVEREKERLAALDAIVQRKETAVDFAKEDLQLAEQMKAPAQTQLEFAQRLDELERQRLVATRDRIQAELDGLLKFGPVVSAQVDKLNSDLEQTNAILERGPVAADRLTQKLKESRDVVIDIGEALSSSLERVINGVLAGGGKGFDLSTILGDTLRTVESDVLGGLAKSFLQGGDLKFKAFGQDFEFKDIADKFSRAVDVFRKGVAQLFGADGSGGSFTEQLRSIFQPLSKALTSSTAGGAATTASGAPVDFSNVVAGGSSTAAAAGGGAAAALGVVGIGIAAAQLVSDQVKALKAGFKEAGEKAFQRGETSLDLAGGAFSKDLAGGIFAGIFGEKVGGNINYAALTSGIGPALEALGVGLFQPKTGGTIAKAELEQLFKKTQLPQQSSYTHGGSGIRAKFLEGAIDQQTLDALAAAGWPITQGDLTGLGQTIWNVGYGTTPSSGRNHNLLEKYLYDQLNAARAAHPGVEALRTNEALGLGVVLGGGDATGASYAMALTNNFLLLGVSTEEAKRQLLELASAAGVDMLTAIKELNKIYLEHGLTMQQLQTSTKGVVDLFTADIPAKIRAYLDIPGIIARRTTESGIDIAGATGDIARGEIAYGLTQQVKNVRDSLLTPRALEAERRRELRDIDAQLQNTGLSDTDRQALLQDRAQIGFDLVAIAQQRYRDGTAQQRRAVESGLHIVEDTAAQLRAIGSDIADPLKENTGTIAENTAAVRLNTAALTGGKDTKIDINVKGGDSGVAHATVKKWVTDAVHQALNSPTQRARAKTTSFNR